MERKVLTAFAVIAVVIGGLSGVAGIARADVGPDEIHYSFGSNADVSTLTDSVVFDWRGTSNIIQYEPDSSFGADGYTHTVTATQPQFPPVDDPGPFQEATLGGLAPGTVYHYSIGGGPDHTFRTVPNGDFTWVDTGDTGSTLCDSWMADTQALILAQGPDFVTHGGDISYANECGQAAVHRYYTDQEVWSHGAAFMPVWGNHEYAGTNKDSLPGATRDYLINYKARSFIPNPQTVPVDTRSKTSNPGCGAEIGSGTNTCQGEGWGWFRAGGVLYISYPEPWVNAYPDWETKVVTLMGEAQADPTIDFIVTYGHRPAYSSQSASVNTALRTALTQLASQYSPTDAHPDGKYVLNINHHIHGEEVFAPIGGLVNITNGGGGAGQANYGTPAANSLYRSPRPGILSAEYSASAHTLTVSLLCGPVYEPKPRPCIPFGDTTPVNYGDALYTQTFTAPSTSPPVATLTAQLDDDGVSTPAPGQSVTYTATASDPVPGTSVAGVTMTLALPAAYSIGNADGGTVSGSTVSWDATDLTGGTPVSHQVTADLDPGAVPGTSLPATLQLSSSDGVCAANGSSCTDSDTDTVASPLHQWIANQSVETNLTGWTGLYSSRSQVTRATTDGQAGSASLQVINKTKARGAAGVNAKPRPVTATTSGQQYTASVWVRGQAAGQTLYLLLEEFRPNGTVAGSGSVRVQVPDTGWYPLTVTYQAAGSGDQLSMSIYCSSLAPQAWFRADMMSLTSPN
jgi:hypothetical protein